MTQPTPAIVAQSAVRRLPRLALVLLCLAYVLPGYLGRTPWKNADITSFGYMLELARDQTAGVATWFNPTLMGLAPEVDALLPYWLGAWALLLAPSWVAPDFAVRLPFVLMLVLTLVATWHGVYHLARSPGAQPVAFAFGGEAQPTDYARAMADGGLLALLACLGLAQLSHETTPALAQLCFTALLFYALAAMPQRRWLPPLAALAGLAGLALSGAPSVAILLAMGGGLLLLLDQSGRSDHSEMTSTERQPPHRARGVAALLLAAALAVALAWVLRLWHWRIDLPEANLTEWRRLGRLFLWFTWPAWPLALWTLWRWRRQLAQLRQHRHLALPLWFATVAAATTLITPAADRALLLALPALATLAAFALPTLDRGVAALIDWFTLLFFSACALAIWVIWLAMQTGVPQQPAANVARLAPGFVPSFSLTALLMALAATLAWLWLVKWRVGRHRSAIWKSLVLPAGGATLCWLLLLTLWLPLLNFARGYAPLVQSVTAITGPGGCIKAQGLSRAQIAAFEFHGQLKVEPFDAAVECPWLVANAPPKGAKAGTPDQRRWVLQATVRRPADKDEDILLFKRRGAPAP